MLINASSICHYLIGKGMVSNEAVVDGDFTVIDRSGRNRNFKVIGRRNSGYFVKQIQQWDAQTIAMLQCEAACYWLARNDGDFAVLAEALPEFYSYDLERNILVSELLPESENLYECFRRVGKLTPEITGRLGQLLGKCHRALASVSYDGPASAIFPRQLPWILSADQRNSHPFKELSQATSELFDVVEGSAELRDGLDELRGGWQTIALMHGDMRLENCVLVGDPGQEKWSLKIVDWELADIGDPCWDIGGIIQACLSACIMYLPMDSHMPTRQNWLPANNLLNGMGATVQSLWENYVAAAETEPTGRLERCLRYAAARMIQSAYEYVQFLPQVSPKAFHLLNLSSEIFNHPERVINLLFRSRSLNPICENSWTKSC